MNTQEVLLLTLIKKSEHHPWLVTMEVPSGLIIETTIGSGGKTPAGPLLSELFIELNAQIQQYPYYYDIRKINTAENRSMRVRFLNNKPTYADIRLLTKKYLSKHAVSSTIAAQEEPVVFNPETNFFTQMNQMNARTRAAAVENGPVIDVKNEYAENENQYWLFYTSETSEVIDGSSFKGYVIGYSWPNGEVVPTRIGDQMIAPNSVKSTVSYLGVEAFGLKNAKSSTNTDKAKYYGLTKDILDEAGKEAVNYNRSLFEAKKIIAVSLQYDTSTKTPITGDNNELTGVAYATNYSTWEEAKDAATSGNFKGINLNKELLKPMFSDYVAVQADNPGSAMLPLAEYTGYTKGSPKDGIKMASWGYDLNLIKPPSKDNVNQESYNGETSKDMDEQIQKAVKEATSTYNDKGNIREDISLKGYINNDLSFVPPYDDRLLKGQVYKPTADLKNELVWDYQHKVRIGDVFIPIPPLSIRVDKQFQNEKVTTMRAKSSLQKSVGSVRNVLSMDLYYHDLESVNGTKVFSHTTDEGEDIYYYMDGLRSLLAQFKKAPFLPIDNDYINTRLGIHNVALRSMNASTVPGFPEALKVSLIVEEFDTAPYLMGVEHLGSKINYPMLRWYYQSLLSEPYIYEPWRSYLPEVERLDNSFTFSIVDEEQLIARRTALHKFRDMKTPEEYKQDLTDVDTEVGKKNTDGERVKKMLEFYDTFMAEFKSKKLMKEHKRVFDKPYEVPLVIGEGVGLDYFNNIITGDIVDLLIGGELKSLDFKETDLGIALAKKIYGENENNLDFSNDRRLFKQGIWGKIVSEPAEGAFYTFRSISSGVGLAGSMLDNKTFDEIKDNDLPGFFQIYLESDEHKKMFKGKDIKGFEIGDSNGGGSTGSQLFLIPAGDIGSTNYLTKLKQIASIAKELEEEVDDYNYEYNGLSAQINQTEENMNMREVKIPDLIPLDLSVSLENNFSTVQVEAATTPTMQYFGSGDPQLQLTFETTESGVEAVDKMFRKIGQFTKEYREGIVSGFLGITNPLVNMFGIRSVLPETVQYNTVAGFPDRKLVTVTLSAFDKTQRRQEALYGYTAGDTDETLKNRAFDNYDPAVDSLYVHERMRQMEIYPDLELPRVSELNEALSKIDAKLTKWENRTDQVFLDPDFYISTSETYRNFLKDTIDDTNSIVFRWEDASGFVADSILAEGNPLKMSSDETTRFEKEAEEADYIDPTLKWKEYGEEAEESKEATDEESLKTATPLVAKPPSYSNNAVKEYILSKSYEKIPDFNTWNGWNGGKKKLKEYEKWKKQVKEPIDSSKIWLCLADNILSSFSDYDIKYASGEKKVLSDKTRHEKTGKLVDAYTTDTKLGKWTWFSAVDYFKLVYNSVNSLSFNNLNDKDSFKQDLTNGAYSLLANAKDQNKGTGIVEETFNVFSDVKGLVTDAVDSFYNVKRMPFQRIMSYMKAVISSESAWNQFANGKPLVYDTNEEKLATKVGIMGARLTKAKSKEEAERLVWDWKYNIKQSVKQMASVYGQGESSKFKEIYARRLDWAVVSHSGVEMPEILSSNDKKDDKADAFQGGLLTPDASAYFMAVLGKRQNDVSMATTDNASGIYVDGRSLLIRPIFNLYNDYPLDQTLNKESEALGNKKEMQEDYKDGYEEAYAEEVKQIHNNVENWTTEEKVKGMFVDMYQHDQVGRMLRAFPSFSLQIIDEGKWFNNFRTWDNFYGYNALHKIDVYKSRKIAADTAIIEMSNMYGGLTSKRKDMEYTDLNLPSFFSSSFWEQYVGNEPTAELLKDRKEIFKTMFLETGARITLRMGYGSDARYLPVTFNGVITEVSTGDVVTITAQGDGLELSNVISGSEDDTNKTFMKVTEPSDYIGKLLTSKGNWMKDLISDSSNGAFFRENPLGIVHFGSSIESANGTWNPFSGEYGEAVQNVYSQNGQFTKEQWMKPDGSSVGAVQGLLGGFTDGTPIDLKSLTSPNDEDNILVKLYGNTPWDIIQTFAACSLDYVAAVFPMETRSSLFFGKPNWPVTYKYDTKYIYDEVGEKWRRELINEHKKTFMQAHVYTSQTSIISNNVNASEEGIYNNVIVSYDGRTAGPLQADNDIRMDRQRTTIVEANLVAKWGTDGNFTDFFGAEYWTTESQALKYGMSTVRDYMKDMYKGAYIVLGDPTVKPHDVCFMDDTTVDMQGIHMVKAVHHSMSLETGFISHIEPDAYVVNFDAELLFMADKIFSVGKTTAMRSAATFMNLAASSIFSGAVIATMARNLGDIAKLFVKFVEPYTEGILNRTHSNFYQTIGNITDNQEIIDLAEELKNRNLGPEEIDKIMDSLKTKRKQLSQFKKDYKGSKKNYRRASQSSTMNSVKKNYSFNRGMDIDDVKVWSKLNEASEDVENARTAYKEIRRSGNKAKLVDISLDVGKLSYKGLKKGGQLAMTLAKSATFWSVIADVALEVITSGLVEMWTRKKQNSECVKVVPLSYKGSSWTAGMNGHRGGVWGDDPSLSDRFYDSEFFDGDLSIEDDWWSLFPKLLNSFESSNFYDDIEGR